MERNEEQKLRELIRRELETREKLLSKDSEEESGFTLNFVERQRIIDDEIRKYYEAKGNYRRYENEDGEFEWLSEEEIRERERQIPIDAEELEVGQRSVRNYFLMIAVLVFVGALLMYIALRQQSGSIQVLSNVPGATIILDGQATEFKTDFVLSNLSPGPHLISIVKSGYGIAGDPARRVEVRAGKEEVVAFMLEPVPPKNGQTKN
ncbi:MAG: carboxypeptidase regulatory-like domain-containing protein [Calditrichaeota bacterium]|nr:carboxypeptidase regulatory-like domain-containing protein [Calditrichota bacterium]MCB9366337.1 carboxypeptidase regulatory-like domain-containing protein [Calditrichota bacterium]